MCMAVDSLTGGRTALFTLAADSASLVTDVVGCSAGDLAVMFGGAEK